MKPHSRRHELLILGLGALVLGLAIIGGYIYLDTHSHDAAKPTEAEVPHKQTRDHDSVSASKQAVSTKLSEAQPVQKKSTDVGYAQLGTDRKLPNQQTSTTRDPSEISMRLVAGIDPGSLLKEVMANYSQYASSKPTLKAPIRAENGETVPFSADIENAPGGNFWIYAPENTQPFIGRLDYHRNCRPCKLGARIRMERSGDILVVYLAGDGGLVVQYSKVKIGVPGYPPAKRDAYLGSVKITQRKYHQLIDAVVVGSSNMATDGHIKEAHITMDGNPLATWHLTPGFSAGPFLSVTYESPQRSVHAEMISSDGRRVSAGSN